MLNFFLKGQARSGGPGTPVQRQGWCIFRPTQIRYTTHPTYWHVVLQLLYGLVAAAPGR